MILLALFLLFGFSRAEMIARLKSPVITQADGLIQVFANCSEDIRREYQQPVARFASDVVRKLYAGEKEKPRRFTSPGLTIHLGDLRTNDTSVIVRVRTNETRIVSRIYLKSPGYADLTRLRTEVIKAFFRSVKNKELSDREAIAAYRQADPDLRIVDERQCLEDWLTHGTGSDKKGLELLRRIIKPGVASKRDILIFASRLYLYPPHHDSCFLNGSTVLSFREAVITSYKDPVARLVALKKSDEVPVYGGGRGEKMTDAARAYWAFLVAFARGEIDQAELLALLDTADTKLNIALEEAGNGQ